ncbi:MAG: metallophosphoesterase [Paracoccus sp. (in: a-proteobacteria)]|uniref:metallophosphoesterase n=1 Tax=Paracoccus sp. TaxID=267 RepID=UPI0026DFFDD5|nr:metallophosphoesterase [Paracoccus sp. (in: a-proteobacteria)]MDO5620490.1 metallophosphoesterase [Paracoccus sp. (in: a-proteobacteria)]
MAHFFTADTHFSDDAVRRFFGRPFGSVAAMDAAMIERAAVVGPDDDFWIIGDFALCDSAAAQDRARVVFEALPGRKHLVRGNHDPDWVVTELPWASVHDLVELDADGRRFVLCHYPLVTWNGVRKGAVQLFGHVHKSWRGAEGQVNVGVDQWDFAPVSADQAEVEALILPPSTLHQQAEGLL